MSPRAVLFLSGVALLLGVLIALVIITQRKAPENDSTVERGSGPYVPP